MADDRSFDAGNYGENPMKGVPMEIVPLIHTPLVRVHIGMQKTPAVRGSVPDFGPRAYWNAPYPPCYSYHDKL